MFTKRRLKPSENLYEPRPNIGYKIRENINNEYRAKRNKARPFAIKVALCGTFCTFLLVASGAQVYRDTHQTPPEAQEQPKVVDEVHIQSVDTTMISTPWRTVPTLENGSLEQNEKIAYAYLISGYDIDFIYTLNGENGLWTHDRIHDNSANTRGTDYGFGVNSYWHPQIINDPKFWNDWEWNMREVYKLWSTGTPFYGYNKKGIIF